MTLQRLMAAFIIVSLVILGGLTAALLSPASHIHVPALANLITICALMLAAMGGVEMGAAVGAMTLTPAVSQGRASLALLASVVPMLGGFAVLWLPSTAAQLAAAIALFALGFAIDFGLHRAGLLPRWFLKLRAIATVAACVTLACALWLA